jgi:hypothetical protein
MSLASQHAIDRIVAKLLRDSGIREPPVPIERVLGHLELHRRYYDLTDPGFLREVGHRLKVGAEQLSLLLREKVQLAGLWWEISM